VVGIDDEVISDGKVWLMWEFEGMMEAKVNVGHGLQLIIKCMKHTLQL
jgi:hypothetical protein